MGTFLKHFFKKKAAKGLREFKVKKIMVKQEMDGFVAYIVNDPETYAWGRTKGEAIGNFVKDHPEIFNTEIEEVWPQSSDE